MWRGMPRRLPELRSPKLESLGNWEIGHVTLIQYLKNINDQEDQKLDKIS